VGAVLDITTLTAIKAFQLTKIGGASGIIRPDDATLRALIEIANKAAQSIKFASDAVLVAQSLRMPGKKIDGSVANDMKYGDYSKEQILDLRWNFEMDQVLLDLDTVSAEYLFSQFRDMATSLFATGEGEQNILRMIQRFQDKSGGTYSSAMLDRTAATHHRTLMFLQEFEKQLSRALIKRRGDVKKYVSNLTSISEQNCFSTILVTF
jgi:hypothetical protein